MTQLYVIRHGETDANRELRFQGQVDPPLNAMGHEQARRLASRIARIAQDDAIDHFYSSDLTRALETARACESALGRAPLTSRGLREQAFGLFDGLSVAEIEASHADLFEHWRRFEPDFALPGAESTRVFHQRVLRAVGDLAAQHSGQTICIVTHGGVLDMLWREATGQDIAGPRQCDIPNAGINLLSWPDAPGTGRPRVLRWADAVHLEGMPPQAVYRQRD